MFWNSGSKEFLIRLRINKDHAAALLRLENVSATATSNISEYSTLIQMVKDGKLIQLKLITV